jgi:hypothetical protein
MFQMRRKKSKKDVSINRMEIKAEPGVLPALRGSNSGACDCIDSALLEENVLASFLVRQSLQLDHQVDHCLTAQ